MQRRTEVRRLAVVQSEGKLITVAFAACELLETHKRSASSKGGTYPAVAGCVACAGSFLLFLRRFRLVG